MADHYFKHVQSCTCRLCDHYLAAQKPHESSNIQVTIENPKTWDFKSVILTLEEFVGFFEEVKRHLKHIIQYNHHGVEVWVDETLKGFHKDHCLCYSCGKFVPEVREENCPIANELFGLDVRYNVVTPVYECPHFEEIDSRKD